MVERPNYGSPTWHVISNALLEAALLIGGVLALLEPGRGWASGWRVERVVEHLKELGLKQVELQPFTIHFSKAEDDLSH